MNTRRYYVFFYEYERAYGAARGRRTRVSKNPKEYQGPFATRAAAERWIDSNARTYQASPNDYKVKRLTPAGFAKAWLG